MTVTKNTFAKYLIAFVLSLACLVGTFNISAQAATTAQKTADSSVEAFTAAQFAVTTGNGWRYALGWSTTKVTISNTGRAGVYVKIYNSNGYPIVYHQWIAAGSSYSTGLYGSGARYRVVAYNNGVRSTVRVSVGAGSVS